MHLDEVLLKDQLEMEEKVKNELDVVLGKNKNTTIHDSVWKHLALCVGTIVYVLSVLIGIFVWVIKGIFV